MIKDEFSIRDFDITILYEVTCDNTNTVIKTLKEINCPKYFLNEALDNLDSCNLNTGLTYTNIKLRKSVIVISKTSSFGQLMNTITHEYYHLICHIQKVLSTYDEEDLAQLMGFLTMRSYNIIKDL